MASPSIFQRIFGGKQLADNADKSLPVPLPAVPYTTNTEATPDNASMVDEGTTRMLVVHAQPVGSSGIQSYFGYVHEDYLQNLRGHQRADVFDKMRRSDSQIKMALTAVKNPIKSAAWSVEAGDDSADAKADAELVEHILFHGMLKPFSVFMHEALSCLDFGHAVFEPIHQIVKDHPKFGSYIGIKQFAHRSPRTIYRFNIDRDSGALVSVTQYAYGDLQRLVDIPAEFLMVFSIDQEGDNYEGISMLRSVYGAYLRKNTYMKLMAIGIEKYAVPTPVAEVPENKQNSQEYANLVAALQIWTSHQQNYLTLPAGWKVDFKPNPFDAEKIQRAIDAEDKAIINGFVANFLDLGTGGGGGSYALGNDKSQFFLDGLDYLASHIADTMNRGVIQDIVKLNRGPRPVYPTLKCSGIADKGGLQLAQSLKFLTEAQVVIPDDELEDNVRTRYNMPKRSNVGQRQVNSPGSPTAMEDKEDGIKPEPKKFAEARSFELAQAPIKAHIKECKDEIKALMQKSLGDISAAMIAQIVSKAKRATPSQRRAVTKSIDKPGATQYKADLKAALASVSAEALAQARKEVPKAKNVKFAEFEDLPKSIQDKITAQSGLLTDSQLADLEKAIFFQYDASIDSTDSMAKVEADLNAAADKYIESASVDAAAGNVTATVVNSVRQAFFMSDDVVEQIASFTFTNPSPVSPICQDLAGTTFDVDDPNLGQYGPPLHHNCKSFLTPNLKDGPRADLETEELKPSKSSLEKYITLSEAKTKGLTFNRKLLSETTEEVTYFRNGEQVHRVVLEYEDATRKNVISGDGVLLANDI